MKAVEDKEELLETRMYRSRATEKRRMVRRRAEDARARRRRVEVFAGMLEFWQTEPSR